MKKPYTVEIENWCVVSLKKENGKDYMKEQGLPVFNETLRECVKFINRESLSGLKKIKISDMEIFYIDGDTVFGYIIRKSYIVKSLKDL
ncbi:MAG: L-rhamnose mutarotase [Flavobacteriaceae bacterium]|jgi:hypothetical protein|nr:L-rhamnose mutarotase [Flavobacteriaceae bacterium]